MVCKHSDSASLGTISAFTKIHKDECTQCFDSQDDPEGVDVCLTCFNGGCVASERQHARHHFKIKSHPLAVNIRRVLTDKAKRLEDGSPPPQKISKLAIVEEDSDENYEYLTSVRCHECNIVSDPKDWPSTIANHIDRVLKSLSSAKQSEVKAWEEQTLACEHTLCLEQEAGKPLEQEGAHCAGCELSENLWLCLTCGNLGCGRKQYDGSGGNNHGLEHFNATGHSVSCKLGTITPEGTADIYCYSCNDAKLDNDLATHLKKWGINVADQSKTEKSMTELQLEQNLKFDFSMTTEDGKELEPKFGAGYTGLKNLGNSCYMASVLQSVFSIPEFQKRYNEQLSQHAKECREDPSKCLYCQLHKIADGLLSGRYSKASEPKSNTESPSQQGIAPGMFKALVGGDHVEFSTMRQQDAYEFFMFLSKAVSQKEHANKSQDPTRLFDFTLEQRLQCNKCKRVRYQSDRTSSISVSLPARKLATDSDEKDTSYQPVGFYECLDQFVQNECIEGYQCPHCSEKTTASKSVKFQTFPEVLVLQARRFEFVNYVPQKLNIPIEFPDTIQLDKYKGIGPQPDEELLPEVKEEPTVDIDSASLDQLLAMGFTEDRCRHALKQTGNIGPDAAMNWLFEHMDDEIPAGPATDEPSGEDISTLCEMGFEVPQAKKALKETSNDMERAIEWLFSHPGDSGDNPTEDAPAGEEALAGDDNPPFHYKVQSFVSHKGTSVHCGHYVAHIFKDDQWILYNDNKVAVSPNPPIGDAYLYFLQREHTNA